MRIRALLPVLISTPLFAWQGTTPQAALEEIARATRAEEIVRHLPEPVEKRIQELATARKQEILSKLLELKSSQLNGSTIRPAQNGDGWEAIDEDGDIKATIKLDNAFVSGLEAMLPLRIEADGESQSFIVKMHLEDHEWRIDDFGPWEKTDLGILQLLHEPTEMEKNEAAARETLGKIEGAVRRYAGTYPQNGYPGSLRALTVGPADVNPESWRYLGVLDESFAADPLIKNGYRFSYLLTDAGDGLKEPGQFEIVATPAEYGVTGKKSFYLDQDGVMHVTTENRPAKGGDPAIDEGRKVVRFLSTD